MRVAIAKVQAAPAHAESHVSSPLLRHKAKPRRVWNMDGKRFKLLKHGQRKETEKAGHHQRISNGMEHPTARVIHSSFI
jgi:arylamine N-acetyltransferase